MEKKTIPGKAEISASDARDRLNAHSPEPSLDWLCTVTPLGEIAFGIQPDDATTARPMVAGNVCYLHTAQCLGRAESLICLLEDWLGAPLDLKPGVPSLLKDECLTMALRLPLSDTAASAEEIVVCLPLDILAHLSAPPPELAMAMQWNTVLCEAAIASIAMPRQQLTLLEPGGLVLMPASFESFWHCQIALCMYPEFVFRAELDVGQQRFIFEPHEPKVTNQPGIRIEAGAVPEADRLIDVVLCHGLAISVDRLTGWAEQPVFALSRALPEFKVELRGPQGILAHGELLPIGNGYGVLVSSITGGWDECADHI